MESSGASILCAKKSWNTFGLPASSCRANTGMVLGPALLSASKHMPLSPTQKKSSSQLDSFAVWQSSRQMIAACPTCRNCLKLRGPSQRAQNEPKPQTKKTYNVLACQHPEISETTNLPPRQERSCAHCALYSRTSYPPSTSPLSHVAGFSKMLLTISPPRVASTESKVSLNCNTC